MAGAGREPAVACRHPPYPQALGVQEIGQLGHVGRLALVPAPRRGNRLAGDPRRGHGMQGVDEHLIGCVQRPHGRFAVQLRTHHTPDRAVPHAHLRQGDRAPGGQRDLQMHQAARVVEAHPVGHLGMPVEQSLFQALEVQVPAEGGDHVTGREGQGTHSCRLREWVMCVTGPRHDPSSERPVPSLKAFGRCRLCRRLIGRIPPAVDHRACRPSPRRSCRRAGTAPCPRRWPEPRRAAARGPTSHSVLCS